jgi:hypothetical protein
MRRNQHIEGKLAIALEPAFDQEEVAPRVGRDAQGQRIAVMPVHDLDRWSAGRQQLQRVIGVALDFRPEPIGAGDDKPEVADLRDVDPRVVHLVDDAEADRKPQPCWTERAADHVLGAARPRRRRAGCAGGVGERFGSIRAIVACSARDEAS